MKYKAKELADGKFAVDAGRNRHYLPMYDTMAEAELNAIVMSAQWYQSQMDKCREVWEKKSMAMLPDDDARKDFYRESDSDWGDLMA